MLSKKNVNKHKIALHDEERRGIFIHKDQLNDTPFGPGDRFSIRKGKREFFSLVIVKDKDGEILFDRNGIFIQRNRRVDILLGGIYEEFSIESDPLFPDRLTIRPLDIGIDLSGFE